MDEKNYYKILQVDPAASTEQIKAAYRRLAFMYHPDQSKDAGTSQQMQALNEAYQVLSDPGRRAEYDQVIKEQTAGEAVATASPVASGPAADAPVDAPTAETVPSPRRAARPQAWFRKQLKLIFQLAILVTILFVWSLITGKVSLPAIGLLVVASLVVVFSVIREIRKH